MCAQNRPQYQHHKALGRHWTVAPEMPSIDFTLPLNESVLLSFKVEKLRSMPLMALQSHQLNVSLSSISLKSAYFLHFFLNYVHIFISSTVLLNIELRFLSNSYSISLMVPLDHLSLFQVGSNISTLNVYKMCLHFQPLCSPCNLYMFILSNEDNLFTFYGFVYTTYSIFL